MTFSRAALAMWRAAEQPDDARCLALFGISGATLQRIESGEIEPEDDIAARIGACLDQFPSPALSHGAGTLGAGGVAHSAAGATLAGGAR